MIDTSMALLPRGNRPKTIASRAQRNDLRKGDARRKKIALERKPRVDADAVSKAGTIWESVSSANGCACRCQMGRAERTSAGP